jgi:hypothetical protein
MIIIKSLSLRHKRRRRQSGVAHHLVICVPLNVQMGIIGPCTLMILMLSATFLLFASAPLLAQNCEAT